MKCNNAITIIFAFVLATLGTTCWAKDGYTGIALPANRYVLDKKIADVTGDKVNDEIYLTGYKDKESNIYSKQLNLVIIDGKLKKQQIISFEKFGGYQPTIFVGDFNGNKISDILVAAPTGGSGGIIDYRIVTIQGKNAMVIFDQNHNSGVKFYGKFVNGFKAELVNDNLGKTVVIDISSSRSRYMAEKIYDEQGIVMRQVQPYSYPFSLLEAIDIDHDGTYELKGHQRIVGAYGADTISNVVSVWRYGNSGWNPIQIEISSFLVKISARPANNKMEDKKSRITQQMKNIADILPNCRTRDGQRRGGNFLAAYTAYYNESKLLYVEENQDSGEYGMAVAKYYFTQGRMFAYERKGRMLVSAGSEPQTVRPVSITLYFDNNRNVVYGQLKINGRESSVQDVYVADAVSAADQLKAHLNMKKN